MWVKTLNATKRSVVLVSWTMQVVCFFRSTTKEAITYDLKTKKGKDIL